MLMLATITTDIFSFLEEHKVYSKIEAIIDLVRLSAYGEEAVKTSNRKLSARWQWETTKVFRFLKVLEQEKYIILATTRDGVEIKVCCCKCNINATPNATLNNLNISKLNNSDATPNAMQMQHQEENLPLNPSKEETTHNKEKDNNKLLSQKKVSPSFPDLTARSKLFQESLRPFLDIYGRDLLNDFYAYWTEPNKSKTKMRYELEKTWDVARRLNTWSRNNFKTYERI